MPLYKRNSSVANHRKRNFSICNGEQYKDLLAIVVWAPPNFGTRLYQPAAKCETWQGACRNKVARTMQDTPRYNLGMFIYWVKWGHAKMHKAEIGLATSGFCSRWAIAYRTHVSYVQFSLGGKACRPSPSLFAIQECSICSVAVKRYIKSGLWRSGWQQTHIISRTNLYCELNALLSEGTSSWVEAFGPLVKRYHSKCQARKLPSRSLQETWMLFARRPSLKGRNKAEEKKTSGETDVRNWWDGEKHPNPQPHKEGRS